MDHVENLTVKRLPQDGGGDAGFGIARDGRFPGFAGGLLDGPVDQGTGEEIPPALDYGLVAVLVGQLGDTLRVPTGTA